MPKQAKWDTSYEGVDPTMAQDLRELRESMAKPAPARKTLGARLRAWLGRKG